VNQKKLFCIASCYYFPLVLFYPFWFPASSISIIIITKTCRSHTLLAEALFLVASKVASSEHELFRWLRDQLGVLGAVAVVPSLPLRRPRRAVAVLLHERHGKAERAGAAP
jgi:hypothetical protein